MKARKRHDGETTRREGGKDMDKITGPEAESVDMWIIQSAALGRMTMEEAYTALYHEFCRAWDVAQAERAHYVELADIRLQEARSECTNQYRDSLSKLHKV